VAVEPKMERKEISTTAAGFDFAIEFRQLLCRFSDADMTSLSACYGGRRRKSAKARNRGKWGSVSAAGAVGI
jgi:hypothetical protein